MSPEKLNQILQARAFRKRIAKQKATAKLAGQSPYSLLERMFLKLVTPVIAKHDEILYRKMDPKGYATKQMISEFDKGIQQLEKVLNKGKVPNRRLVSSLLSSIPVIASVPLAYPHHKKSVDDSLLRLSEASKKMDTDTGAVLQGLLCVISLVSNPTPEMEEQTIV